MTIFENELEYTLKTFFNLLSQSPGIIRGARNMELDLSKYLLKMAKAGRQSRTRQNLVFM